MAKKTQGTQVYFIDPDDDSIVEVTGVTTFNPGGAPSDEIDITSLTSTDKEYVAGLRSPTDASIEINADPTNASHIRLFALFLAGTVLKWAAGWSDGTAAATNDSSLWDLPTSRTWYRFDGFVKDFPFDFSVNSVVKSTITIRKSGPAALDEKST
jgi:hypothetical protein